MKNIMKKAHEMTKEICNKYKDIDYKTQLGLCLSFLSKEGEKEKMINYETLEYTFVFEKANSNIEVTLKDNGLYQELILTNLCINNKEFKAAQKLAKTVKDNKCLYLVKLTKAMKKELGVEKVDYLSYSDEVQEFIRNYGYNRTSFLVKRDEKTFDLNATYELELQRDTCSPIVVKTSNEYAKSFEKNLKEGLNLILSDLRSYQVDDCIFRLTGKELVEFNEKAIEDAKEIEQEKANKLAALKEKARLEGKQLMEQWIENKRCEVIICRKYMMPNGKTRVERERTY